jgi:hypothetical protein
MSYQGRNEACPLRFSTLGEKDGASDCLEDLAGSRPSFDRHLEFGDFLRLLVTDFFDARVLVLGRAFGFVISFSMVFC